MSKNDLTTVSRQAIEARDRLQEAVSARIAELGLTEAARLSGLSRQRVDQINRGAQPTSVDKLAEIAGKLS